MGSQLRALEVEQEAMAPPNAEQRKYDIPALILKCIHRKTTILEEN